MSDEFENENQQDEEILDDVPVTEPDTTEPSEPVDPSEPDIPDEPTEPEVPEDVPVQSEGKPSETPSIELIVETGDCLPEANSYVTLEFARKYAIQRGYTELLGLSDEELKIFLIRGSDYVDHIYKYRGTKCTSTQSMAFPRKDLIDDDGFTVEGIPLNLKKAVVEASNLVRTQSTLFITKNKDGAIKRKKVDVLETEFFENTSTGEDYTTIYEVLNSLLEGLYRTDSERLSFNVGSVWIDD